MRKHRTLNIVKGVDDVLEDIGNIPEKFHLIYDITQNLPRKIKIERKYFYTPKAADIVNTTFGNSYHRGLSANYMITLKMKYIFKP